MAGRLTIFLFLLVCFSVAVVSAIPVRWSQSESPYAHAVKRRWIDRELPLPPHLMLRPHVSTQEQETTPPSRPSNSGKRSGLLSTLKPGQILYLMLYTYDLASFSGRRGWGGGGTRPTYDPNGPIFG